MATRSYFGLNLEVSEEVCAAVAEGRKIFRVVSIGARFRLLLVAVAVALSSYVGGRSFRVSGSGVGEAAAICDFAFLAVITWPLAIALHAC